MDLVRAVFWIEAEGELDVSVVLGEYAIEQGDVLFVDEALLELVGELPVCAAGEGEKEDAGGVHIQPMHGGVFDFRVKSAGNEGGGTGLIFWSPAGRAEQSAGFIYHDDGCIVVDDF